MIKSALNEGYTDENAEAYVCQNLVLMALSKSTLGRNVTIKGGVVFQSGMAVRQMSSIPSARAMTLPVKKVIAFATSGGSPIGKTAEKLAPYLTNCTDLEAVLVKNLDDLKKLAD